MAAPPAARAPRAPSGPPAARRPPAPARWRRRGSAAPRDAGAGGAGRSGGGWRLGGASDGSFLQAGPSSIPLRSDGNGRGGAPGRRAVGRPVAPPSWTAMVVRPAQAGDADAVAAIYNRGIAERQAT